MRGRSEAERAAAKAARKERRAAKAEVARARRRARLPQAIVSLVASGAVVVLAVAMLYFPAQNYYLAVRQNERLTNELNANLARNEQMQSRVENLQTQEGIEDEARARFGLVEPGENLVKVVGVDEPSQGDFATPTEVPRGSGQNTHTWGTDLLDRIFGVQITTTVPTASPDEPAQVTEGNGETTGAGSSAGPDAGMATVESGQPAAGDTGGTAGTGDAQPAAGDGATNENADIVVEGETPQA